MEPISIVGAKLLWKNAQKKAKKKNTSDIIKNITPYLKPFCTIPVWCPSNVDSRIISRHQTNIIINNIKNPKHKINPPWVYACIYNTPPVTQEKAEKEATNGHGLGSTRWKGCRCVNLEIFDR